jgi:hypothetical protein
MNDKYKIDNNSIYNSSKLLFSIPIHEKQDIINNQIENIFNYNPNSSIIFHINNSFKNFDEKLTNYNNVYFNSNRFNYKYARGLFWIHVNNFLEALKLNIDFEYFIIYSSNEMFIKNGLIHYIEKVKNGAQIVKFDKNNDWHNFHKDIENKEMMINLLKDIGLDTIYGGQTEGQFYQKEYFSKISAIYIKHFGTNELNDFETEEILPQTIFKSFNVEYGLPITIHNYSNKYEFTPEVINNILNNNFKIIGKKFKHKLNLAHHGVNDMVSAFSIKRVDRTFNNLRYYLTRNGFILNKELFQYNTYYYSHNSKIILNDNIIHFTKYNKGIFHSFGYNIEKGNYVITFKIKMNKKINYYKNIGIKVNNNLINYFFENLKENKWNLITLNIHVLENDILNFVFDDYDENISIIIKELKINNFSSDYLHKNKENIIISLYENINYNDNEDYETNFNNIYNMIIEPFSNIYNIIIFNTIFNKNNNNVILNNYKPYQFITLDKVENINYIFYKNIQITNNFTELYNIDYKFNIFISLDSIFKKKITDFNFYVNKINFISYYIPYYDNKICNSYQFLSFPKKYINDFYNLITKNINNKNICYSIYSNLINTIEKSQFNFIYDDNYSKNINTPLIKYLSNINNQKNNKGYLFNVKYYYDVYYSNNYSKILKNSNNEFYFSKIKTINNTPFQWIGLYIDNITQNDNKVENINVNFQIKILNKINNNNNEEYGLKTHDPLNYYKDWIDKCIINEYVQININININRVNQYILLNFDNYTDKIEFYIKDFQIIMNYN